MLKMNYVFNNQDDQDFKQKGAKKNGIQATASHNRREKLHTLVTYISRKQEVGRDGKMTWLWHIRKLIGLSFKQIIRTTVAILMLLPQ